MSGLTKEGLRTALITHGIETPAMSASKVELLQLYQEHVAPLDSGDFSADEEEEVNPPRKSPRKSASSKEDLVLALTTAETKDGDLVDVTAFDDDDLFSKLREHGIEVGPIVASTRPFYEKKLAAVLAGTVLPGVDEFSDNEEEEEKFDKLELRSRIVTETLSKVEDFGQEEEELVATQEAFPETSARVDDIGQGSEPAEFDTLLLRNRIVTETLSNVEDFGQDEEEDDASAQEIILEKRVTRSTTSSNVSSPLTDTGLRQRLAPDQVDGEDMDPHPSPRQSIHSYRVTSSSSRSLIDSEEEVIVVGGKVKPTFLLTLVKLVVVLAALGLVVFVVLTNLAEDGVTPAEEVEEAVNNAFPDVSEV